MHRGEMMQYQIIATADMVAARRWLRDATRMLHELNQSTERKQGEDTSR